MITIDHKPLDADVFLKDYPEGGVARSVVNILMSSGATADYKSLEELRFELRLREEIARAAKELERSGVDFEVFRETRCNPNYWYRRQDGGFELRSSVRASDAIRDIFENGRRYGTECATAIQIIYYKALLETFGDSAFNKMFKDITLMNWHEISEPLRETGAMQRYDAYLPGDRRYFVNPDVDPDTPEWQGENVIDLGGGVYFGHGVGRGDAASFIRELNENRRFGAHEPAYLMNTAGRPNFKKLAALYDRLVDAPIQERSA